MKLQDLYKALLLLFVLFLASCSKDTVSSDDYDSRDYSREQLNFVRYSILGDLGEWSEEIDYALKGSCSSTQYDDCQVIFTDVTELISQADALFEALDSGAFIVVVNPDLDRMMNSLGDYAEELGLTKNSEEDPLMIAFSDNDFFEIHKPVSYTGEIADSLGTVLQPESYEDCDYIDYAGIVDELAGWLEQSDGTISTKADGEKEKQSGIPILPTDKQTMHCIRRVYYKNQVKHLTGYDDEVWTKGYIDFVADFKVAPMYGLQNDGLGYDYYYFEATYSNNFGNVISQIAENTPTSSGKASSDDSICITYNYDNDDHEYTKRDYHGGDIPDNYVFQVKWSLCDLHVCGPMQKEFGFTTSIDKSQGTMGNDKVISFMQGYSPIPLSENGKTTYTSSKTYSFGGDIALGGYGGKSITKENGKVSSVEPYGGGDISASFNWGKTETQSHTFELKDMEIGQIGDNGEAGWRQRFNNLPGQSGEAGFSDRIKNIAISNGRHTGSWVWQVRDTKSSGENYIGKVNTHFFMRLRTLCNAYACSFVEKIWSISTDVCCDQELFPPRRVANGQVTIMNDVNYKLTNIKFIPKDTAKNTITVYSKGGVTIAAIYEDKCVHVNIPEGLYDVEYDVCSLNENREEVIVHKTLGQEVNIPYAKEVGLDLR